MNTLSTKRNFFNANTMNAEIKTTGLCGGDAGHGGYAEVNIMDDGGTGWELSFCQSGDEGPGYQVSDLKKISLKFMGDSEIKMAIDVFRYLADELEETCKLIKNGKLTDVVKEGEA